MTPPRPVLQIVHVSDLHVVARRHPAAPVVRKMERWAKRVYPPLYRKLRDGTAPNDGFAAIRMTRFIKKIAGEPEWRQLPTWVVDTGDQTTYGDVGSQRRAQYHLKQWLEATATAAPAGLWRLYGNHDAWPDDIPWRGSGAKIITHTTELARAGYIVHRVAEHTARLSGLAGGVEIHLHTFDTVDDRALPNFFASGIGRPAEMAALAAISRAGTALRILATHHPIHYPPPRPRGMMAIANDRAVGKLVDSSPPLLDLVLSGHTHALYPEIGMLPTTPGRCAHHPLGTQQVQLIVGSLMQEDRFGQRGPHPHHCQVLRFYQDSDDPRAIRLRRFLGTRNPKARPLDALGKMLGEFEFLVGDDDQPYFEEIVFTL